MNRELRIAMIGAGAVNFGGGEGPWDHASRLEKIAGVRVVAVVDPDQQRARKQLGRRSSPSFQGAKVYAEYARMLEEVHPDAVWIGVPPHAHGSLEGGRDVERCCAEAGVHMFIEKPLSSSPPDTVRAVAETLSKHKVFASVGYMFRYSRAVEKIRSILQGSGGGVRAFQARYNCAYSEIRKREWWDTRCTGGPIVEQATHFLDLARFLVGEVETSSVRSIRIPADSPLGALDDIPQTDDGATFEETVPAEFRAPRATAAVWKFQSGALGTLNHATLLHGKKYEAEVEIWGDGLRIELVEPYGACRLRVRFPHSEQVEEFSFADDDPYLNEDRAFVETIRSGDGALIRCPYADAAKTHELAWAITGS